MRYRKTAISVVLSILMALLLTSNTTMPVAALASGANNVATTDTPTAPRITIPIVVADPKVAGQTIQVGTFVPDLKITKTSNIHYTWGWVTGTAYLNKSESRSLRTYSYGVLVASGLCIAFGSVTAGIACAVSGAMVAQWNYVASNAVAAGACVKIKVPIMWAYQYTGGDCW